MYDARLAPLTIGSPAFLAKARVETRFFFDELGLRAGDRLLDVPCGIGRHAELFGRRGVRVTGIDISPDCIALAKRRCRGLPVRLLRGDMGRLGRFRGQFRFVANLFTSFGYFSTDAKNARFLRELAGALAPGGTLVLHVIDRDWLLPRFRPVEWRSEGGKLIIEARQYDARTRYGEEHFVVLDEKTGRGRDYYHRVRLYSAREMLALLRGAGLRGARAYGNWQGAPYRKGASDHPIYVAHKG